MKFARSVGAELRLDHLNSMKIQEILDTAPRGMLTEQHDQRQSGSMSRECGVSGTNAVL